ncbi:septum formation family protein [Dactylosporangium sp. CA-233914]|uniref:septum formation family protein n=1 Tax=Dactylosporangium sp. CA-233914 TaxID=3239934 RepID=UPI003D8DDACB
MLTLFIGARNDTGATTVKKAARFVTVGALVLATAACQAPAGTDGDLADDWRPLPSPAFEVPDVGQCFDGQARFSFDPRFYRATPVACERRHALEVVLVGTVDGEAAAAAAPPEPGSAGYQAAYAACGKAADEYVGGDWHDGLLGIDVQLPTKTPWGGGQRTYVCTVYGSATAYGTMAFRTGSLKGAMAGAAPSAMHCLDVVAEQRADGWYQHLSAMTPIDCAKPHGAEYTGSVIVPGTTLPVGDKLETMMIDACWAKVAAFLGLTQSQLSSRSDIHITWDGMSQNQWQSGDHHQRCFAMVPYQRKVHASLKGLGKTALPV